MCDEMQVMLEQQEELTTLRAENERLTARVSNLERKLCEKNQRIAQHELETLMGVRRLPLESRRRLREAFRNATTTDGMKQACNVEASATKPLTPDLVART